MAPKIIIDRWTSLSLRIIFVFMCAMLFSVIPDYLHTFFGDWFHNAFAKHDSSIMWDHPYTSEWHWGWRHYIWFAMGMFLFIVQAVRICTYIEKTFGV